MIVVLGLLAIAFSTQLLPLTVDMLYLQRGTRQGAIAGLCIGLTTILLLSPFFPMLAGNALQDVLGSMKTMIDTGAWGLLFNVLTFTVVSHFTRK
jgi:Na+/proline symporter